MARLGRARRLASEQRRDPRADRSGAVRALLGAMPLLVHAAGDWSSGRATLNDSRSGFDALARYAAARACSGLRGSLGLRSVPRRRARSCCSGAGMLPRLRSASPAIAGGSVLLVPVHARDRDRAPCVRGASRRDGLLVIVASAVILLFAILAHDRRYSMHLFYRERIQDAFASRRAHRRRPRRGSHDRASRSRTPSGSSSARSPAGSKRSSSRGRRAVPELVDLRGGRGPRDRGPEQDPGGELHVPGRVLGQQVGWG